MKKYGKLARFARGMCCHRNTADSILYTTGEDDVTSLFYEFGNAGDGRMTRRLGVI